MEALRSVGDSVAMTRFEACKEDLAKLLLEEETFWRQRAKTFWLKDGDINSRFFHAAATSKREANKIKKLHDAQGNVFENLVDFKSIVRDYFLEMYTAGSDPNYDVVLAHVKPLVTNDENEFLLSQFDILEFKDAVFSMHPDKSPGLDGLNPAFF